ncbi:MAG: hypothetical protein LBM65_04990 [Oscillospiraceae bacterium]|jgi:hypothetical protein|nr:hypothetical protein [Oscillospiraceae bacterium]
MEFLKNLLENPMYLFLFGGGGVLVVFFAILALVKKNKPTDTQKGNDTASSTPPIPIVITVKPPAETRSPQPKNIIFPKPTIPAKKSKPNISTPHSADKKELEFVKNLIYNSPPDDKITITKIKNPEKYI